MNVCPKCRHRGPERSCPEDGYPMVSEARFDQSAEVVDLRGRVFDGKYLLVERIGQGAMGEVWRARHSVMHHEVALKLLRPDVNAGLNAVQRFYNEARASSRLSHPNTIRVSDFGVTEDGFLYMAMELLEGADLGRVLKTEGALEPVRVMRIAAQVCKSLSEAHARAMVHRDLKPSNVFLARVHGESDFVKVIDFGIAKAVEVTEDGTSLTRTGVVIGTPRYVSPEQVRGLHLDARSDLYSLGILIHEMLTGDIPFEAGTTTALLLAHATVAPRPLPSVVRGRPIPGRLRALVAALLEKDPEARPQDATTVLHWLEATLAEGSSPATGFATASRRGEVPPGPADARTTRIPPPSRLTAVFATGDNVSGPHEETGVEPTHVLRIEAPTPSALPDVPRRAAAVLGRPWRVQAGLGAVALLGFAAVLWATLGAGEEDAGHDLAPPDVPTTAAAYPWGASPWASPREDEPAREAVRPAVVRNAPPPPQQAVAARAEPALETAAGVAIATPPGAPAVPATSPAAAPAPPSGGSPEAVDAVAPPVTPRAADPPRKAEAVVDPPPRAVTVRLSSSPSGADVRAGAVVLGRTPLDLTIAAGRVREVTLVQEGRRPVTRTISPDDAPEVTVRLERAGRPRAPRPEGRAPAVRPAEPRPRAEPKIDYL